MSKYRIGLSSANSSSNNNPIIPKIPFNRPISNFNFGGNKLWKIDNNNTNQKYADKSNININNNISPIKSLNHKEFMNNLIKNTIKKRKIVKSMDLKKNSLKIEKGMMNKNNFGNDINNKIIDNKVISVRSNKKIFFI